MKPTNILTATLMGKSSKVFGSSSSLRQKANPNKFISLRKDLNVILKTYRHRELFNPTYIDLPHLKRLLDKNDQSLGAQSDM